MYVSNCLCFRRSLRMLSFYFEIILQTIFNFLSLWNHLSDHIKNETLAKAFKTKLVGNW